MKTTLIMMSLLAKCMASNLMLEEQYQANYKPQVTEDILGPQIVAPATPYVAAEGRNKLYFIDTRHQRRRISHQGADWASLCASESNTKIKVDESTVVVHNINFITGEVLFIFDVPLLCCGRTTDHVRSLEKSLLLD